MLFYFSSKGKRIWAFCFAVMGRYEMDFCGCCLAFCGTATSFVTAVLSQNRVVVGRELRAGISGEMLQFSGQGRVGCFLLPVSFLKCNFPWKLSFLFIYVFNSYLCLIISGILRTWMCVFCCCLHFKVFRFFSIRNSEI